MVAGFIGGADYALEVVRSVAPAVLLVAAFTASLAIAWRYSRIVAVILYGAWLVAGAVIGVRAGDAETIEAVWGLGLLGFTSLVVYVVTRRKRRRDREPS